MDAGVGGFATSFECGSFILTSDSERTKNRPLASGRISVFAATSYALMQYAIGTAWFYLTVEDLA